jgi:hypothetical protein
VALLSLKSSVREGKVTVITKTGKHDTFELNKRVLLLGEKNLEQMPRDTSRWWPSAGHPALEGCFINIG